MGGNLYAVDRVKLSPPWKPISEDDKKSEEVKIQKVQPEVKEPEPVEK